MPNRPNYSIAERLNTAKVTIANSLAEPEIQSLVEDYGYSSGRLNEGMALYEAALAAVNAQKSAEGAQQQATQELKSAEKTARDAYQSLAKVARAIFKNDKARLTAFGLKGTAPITTAGFLAAASVLFDNAAAAPSLPEFGYDAARMASERAKINAFDLANQKQEAAKGAAQQATREQVSALAALDAWNAQYLKIARVALRSKAQLLEKIGVAARTTKTAAQRASAKKKALA
jgi:hypothetical protein